MVTLDAEEARALLAVLSASTDMRAQVAAFALSMGMRGECYGLHRRDVDRTGGYVLVRQTGRQAAQTWRDDPGKSRQ